MPPDPFATLGIAASATDAELRSAYRRLAQRHHPDHNDGSAESAERFAEIQEAYAHVRLLRRSALRPAPGQTDDALEAKIAQMEDDLRRARADRERAAQRAARVRRATPPRSEPTDERPPPRPATPSREELGYVSSDDSFSKILDDFADGIAGQVADARAAAQNAPARRRVSKSVSEWIDELSSRLTGEDH
jgi:curved DNA-binding protein CbpA